MKTTIIALILETLFSKRDRKNKPRADMYLPDYVMGIGLVMFVIAIGFIVAFIFRHALWMMAVAAGSILIGIAALMCWKNQMIRILSDEKFEYTSFLGNKYTYRFDEITKIRKNSDSLTVFVRDKKVHIENCAIISNELIKALNKSIR